MQLEAFLGQGASADALAVAHQAAHVVAALAQAAGKATVDEAAGAGHRRVHLSLRLAD